MLSLLSPQHPRQGSAAALSGGRNGEFKVASISQGCLKWSSPPEFSPLLPLSALLSSS